MKVLVVHNRYRSDAPSGENTMVDAEIRLLIDHGVEVIPMIEESDTISRGLRGALAAGPGPVYSRRGVERFKALLREHRPDVVHLHNVFPLISPWVVRVANQHRVPVVQTVHNYRHTCVNGLHFRDGHACTDCLPTRTNWPAVKHACYRGSHMQSMPMVLSQDLHKRTWAGGVAVFVALTQFMASMLERAGMPSERVRIRPTWVPDPGAPVSAGRDVLFVGRLDESKGLPLLLDAWKGTHTASARRKLRIIGDGPMAPEMSSLASPHIEYEGAQSPAAVRLAMDECAFVVAPSLCLEGYPLVVAEAFSRARPVLTVAGGSTASIVERGGVGWVSSSSPGDLRRRVDELSDEQIAAAGVAARMTYDRENSPQAAWESVQQIYATAVSGSRGAFLA